MIVILSIYILAILINGALISYLIKLMNKKSLTQVIREQGPESHKTKSSTPTMGGISFLITATLFYILWVVYIKFANFVDSEPVNWVPGLICLLMAIGAGTIGLVDDILKARGSKAGFKARYRIVLQFAIGFLLGWYVYSLKIPIITNWGALDLKWVTIPFVAFVFVGTINAVNFTDGLDGLLSGTSVIYGGFFILLLLYLDSNGIYREIETNSFQTLKNFNYMTMCYILAGILIAVCISFLWFNCHPAKIFMGDVGSMFIGGLIASMACVTGLELFLLVAGGIFVVEMLSVILQVASFRLTGKRIFKMSPLHHHFELSGWKETQVVTRFWIVAAFLGLIALAIFVR